MFKEHKIVVLPSENVRGLFVEKSFYKTTVGTFGYSIIQPDWTVQKYDLYLVSDEEIKVGDWAMSERNTSKLHYPFKCKNSAFVSPSFLNSEDCNDIYKVIASTDQSLNLPKFSQSFIKKYCELGGINSVMVEYELIGMSISLGIKNWELKIRPDNTIITKKVKDSWNRDEVMKLIEKSYYQGFEDGEIPEYDKDIRFGLANTISKLLS